jgi:hypothetical protein
MWGIEFEDEKTYQATTSCSDQTVTPPPPLSYQLPTKVKIASITLVIGTSDCQTDGKYFTENPEKFAVNFNNISGEVNFKTGSTGCPVSVLTQKMIIALQWDTDAANLEKVIVEKGGAIYLGS